MQGKWCPNQKENRIYSNAFFLGNANYKFDKKSIEMLDIEGKGQITDGLMIRNELKTFFTDLYTSKYITYPDFTKINHLQGLTELTEQDKRTLDKGITIQECNSALKRFKNNKSPGCDGLSKEFYEKIWERLGPILIEAYNCSLQTGTLTNTHPPS